MAERKIANNLTLLLISTDGGTTYKTVICGTKVARSLQAQEIDAGTFCGPDKSVGDITGNVTFEGQHMIDPDTNRISGNSIFTLMVNKTTIDWKIAPLTPVADDIIETGQGFINSLDDTYQYNTQATFSFSIAIKGVPEQEIFVP